MKSYNIVITEPAEADLQEIANYIAKELKVPRLAEELVANIGEAIFDLEKFPMRHALVADENLAMQGIRKLLVANSMVFYVVYENDKVVTVLRILYGRRDWINLL